ncbi:MAG: hypothetical protein JNK60_19825 [Acidobacteria bacterium]|nr:hypothetical protein [Acidobacteriota bacterium]
MPKKSLFAISLLLLPSLLKADGALDPSFGIGGKVRIGWSPVGSGAFMAVAHQTDGRIVAAGQTQGSGAPSDLVLMRFTQSGQPDATFGVAGISIVSIGAFDIARGLAILPSGKILLIATSEGVGPLLARFDPDGSLDRSFGTNGYVLLSAPPASPSAMYPRAIALQADGRVIVVGNIEGEPWGIFVVRRLPDGSPDSSFGTAGGVILRTGPGVRDAATQVLVQSDLRIVVVGDADTNGSSKFLAVRLESNGSLDGSFGSGGYATLSIPMGVSSGFTTGALQSGERIVFGGSVAAPITADQDFAMARLTASGALDTTFGQGGWVQRSLSTASVDNVISLLTISGRLVVVGTTYRGPVGHTFLARYSGNGVADPSYGPDGTGVLTSLYPDATKDLPTGASVSPDGRVVVAGGVFEDFYNQDFLVLRVDPPCASGFGVSATTSVCPAGEAFATVRGGSPGSSYVWTIENGTIQSGQGTPTLRYLAAATGATRLHVNVADGVCEVQGTAQTFIDAAGCAGALGFYTLAPCRVVDTRLPADPAGGPSLQAGRSRRFPIAAQGTCGVPADARAVAVNVTVLSATSSGHLRVAAEGIPAPPTFVNAFRPGETRATCAQLTLGENGAIRVESTQPTGTVDVLVDVSGYYK